jgi:AcrR family transcriptional regulator
LPEVETVRSFRRAQIVAASRRLIAEQGLEALTFSALESQLSFTRGVITYHFKNKADIIRVVLEDVVAEIDDATYGSLGPSDDLHEAVSGVMSGMIRGFVRNREASAVLISYWSRAPREAGLHSELFARYRRHSSLLIERAGGHKDPNATSALASVMVSVVIGSVIQLYLSEEFATVEAVADEAVATVYARLCQLSQR